MSCLKFLFTTSKFTVIYANLIMLNFFMIFYLALFLIIHEYFPVNLLALVLLCFKKKFMTRLCMFPIELLGNKTGIT